MHANLTYQLLVGQVALRIGVVLVLIFILCLAQSFLQLVVVITRQISLQLWRKSCLFLFSNLLDPMYQPQVTDCILDYRSVLLQRLISEFNEVFEGLEGELAEHVLVVVVVILHHVFGMQLSILQFFKGLSVVAVLVVGTAAHVLEPHRLVVMDAHIVAAVLHKDVHYSCSTLHIARLERHHGRLGVDGAISFVKVTRLLVEYGGAHPVALLLENSTLKRVKLKQSGRVVDGLVNKLECFI